MCNTAFVLLLVIDDTTKEIVYRDYVDISVAVATPRVGTLNALAMLPAASGLGYTLSQLSFELHCSTNLLMRRM